MKPLLMLLLTIVTCFSAVAQSHDYEKLRSSLGLLSCGLSDSATIVSNYQKLLHVDTTVYHQHLDIYLQDLAMACYKMSFVKKDRSYLEQDASLLKGALAINPKSEAARWNYLFVLFLLKRCDEANTQLAYYLSHTAKANVDTAQVRSIRARCQ
jgi:hypothetical protein